MVRRKVRAQSLLLKTTHCNEKVRRTQFYLEKKTKQICKQINKQANKPKW